MCSDHFVKDGVLMFVFIIDAGGCIGVMMVRWVCNDEKVWIVKDGTFKGGPVWF